MADPKLPDINPELAALPYDNEVKRQIYDAFYSDNDETSKQILESLPIPGKLKNDFYERRHTSAKPAVASQTQQPPTEGILARAEKNLPRSGANFIKGLGTAAVDAATLGAGRLTQSVKNVGQATGKALKTGGVSAAIDAGLEQGVTEAFAPILGFAKHVASRVMNPMESFAEDPVGTVADVASLVIPALSSERGAIAVNRAKSAVGMKPTPPPKVSRPTTPATPAGAQPQASEPPPVVPASGPAAESAKVFQSGVKPVSRDRAARIEKLRSKIKTKPTAPPPVAEKQEPLRPDQKQLPAPEPISNPRFYADESGNIADASRPRTQQPTMQTQLEAGPQPGAMKQLEAPAQQKALPAAEPPTEGYIDGEALSAEYGVPQDALYRFAKLDTKTLEHVAHQADELVRSIIGSGVADPVALAKASESSRAARAILQQKSYYVEGTKSPLEYSTSKAPIPGNNPNVEAVADTINTQRIEGLKPQEVPQPPQAPKSKASRKPEQAAQPDVTPAPAPAPAPVEPQAQVAVEPQVPVAAPPTPVEAPIAPPAKPMVKPPAASKPAVKPAAAPVKPKALEVAQAQVKASAPPTVKPAAKQEPVTPTVTAKAEAVEPVASPVPQVLKEGDGFTEASIRNGKASYKTKSANGNIDVKPGERAFYREIDGDTDIYTVRESGGKVNVYDIEDNVVASYPKGTPAEKAMEQKFGRTVTTAQAPAPQVPATPAKSSPIPKKKEQPVAKEVKAEEAAKEATPKTDEPPNLSREAFMEKLKELTDRMTDGEDLSKAEIAEMRRLARRVEQVEVAAPVYKLKAAKGEKIMKPKISKDSAEIEVAAYDKNTGNYPIKEKYTISKEGDKYVIIDKSRKRIGSYDAKTIQEAVDLALKD